MNHWALQDGKARFSKLIDSSVKDGPQIITKRGVPTAVVISYEEWQKQQQTRSPQERPSLKELLLSDPRRFELDIPPRGQWKRRPPLDFD